MDYSKYIGKGWTISFKQKAYYANRPKEFATEDYFIIDIKEFEVETFKKIKDDSVSGYSYETIKELKLALLAIKLKFHNGNIRYSITNPTKQYAVNPEFLKQLKRDKRVDKFPRECIKYLFEKGFDKWTKRYSGYNNLLK